MKVSYCMDLRGNGMIYRLNIIVSWQ